jgi:predicted dehydrogenase
MRIGILGAGGMGSAHARLYGTMPDVQVAGIVGRTQEKVQAVATSLGIPGYTDPRRLLDDDRVEAIDVCYPTYLHAEYAIAALRRGKHVFCEVPLALTLEETDAMLAAARASDRLLLVAFVVRFVDANVYVRDVVQAGELGAPQAVTMTYLFRRDPSWAARRAAGFGTVLVEQVSHEFDYLNWLLGRPNALLATGLAGADGDLEHLWVLLEYADRRAAIEVSTLLPASHPFTTHLRVVCADGALDTTFRMPVDGPPETLLTRYPGAGAPETPSIPDEDPYWTECRYFADCVAGKADPRRMSAEAARDSLQLALAAQESFERGGVRVDLTW